MYWVGVVTAGMTAFYVFRALFLCFFGPYRGPHHPQESPAVMWVPLAILAVLSLAGGYLDVPRFLEPVFGPEEGAAGAWLVYVSVAAGVSGIALAALFYLVRPEIPEALAKMFGGGPYRWVYNKYFVDEAYDATLVSPVVDGSRQLLWRTGDVRIIDGAANGIGTVARGLGALLRGLQSGYIRNYAAWVLAGTLFLIAWVGMNGLVR
jgi:NADH-quinone oxidoreductase subunit L